ncbi:LacI family DNA-binding transcriptional regulator [uncultured Cohaesibacter sp.]|uniref:LacI family DNA-binding transcriptional regulator n=1 Tax=uncultured Cohaesibacter sp. TaxID=1002546 RepID=UPI0029C85D48|nr:LacI family DNA-binding transcriptional regulator [uncultured Cohaesibacter sp.]
MKNKKTNKSGSSEQRARGNKGQVRLADVAALAGVSTATVSRTFNEPQKVKKEVRERTLAAAAELNWIPNAAGKALASSRTHIAGAIIPTLDDEIYARQISGLQSGLSEHGLTLFLGCTNYDPQQGLNQATAMLTRGVEALVLAGENYPDDLFKALEMRKVPFLITYSYRKDLPFAFVGFDNHAAFSRITEHFLSLGHRKFGAIFQPLENNSRATERLRGLKETLAQAGVALSESNLRVGKASLDFGATSFKELMSGDASDRPTAIICGNDALALGALMAAKDLGLSAPEDFSISGFDDLAMSSRFSPKLTTMKVDNQRIGSLAAQILGEVAKGSVDKSRSIEIKPEFHIRESTGPVPQNS